MTAAPDDLAARVAGLIHGPDPIYVGACSNCGGAMMAAAPADLCGHCAGLDDEDRRAFRVSTEAAVGAIAPARWTLWREGRS